MEYISCEWIENRVVLEQDKLKFCCIGHSGSKGYVPICDYDGGELPVEEILAARRDLIARNNDPRAKSGCKGCHFLEKRDWDAERGDALFKSVYVSNFSICNLSCRYCFVYLMEFTDISNVKGYDLLPIFQEMIEKGHLANDAYIEWGGGEPTIVKNFPEVMQLLLEKGYEQQIHTSAVRHSQELEDGLRTGHVRSVTSVDAGTRATYHEVKGRDRFDIVWENVGKYARTGGDMTVKYVLRYNNSSEENIRGFIDKVLEAGVRRIVATPDFREIAQKQVSEETVAAFALLAHLAEENGIEIELRDEYVNPKQMKMVTKYMPWTEKRGEYEAHRERAAAEAAAEVARREEKRLRNADRTREAVDRTEQALARSARVVHPFQLIEEAPIADLPVRDLFAHQIDTPTPELRASLTRLVRARSLPGRVDMEGLTTLGLSPDAWTQDVDPAYLVLDATDSDEPLEQDVWFLCWAPPEYYPIHMTITDGAGETIEYTFMEPYRLRVQMPTVPAGESAIYVLTTDKSWTPPDEPIPRRVGVHVATKV